MGNLDYKDIVESSSSRGPTKDGRLKPDICAKGTNVTSSTTNNSYVSLTGTSMSSPGVAGCMAQLIDAYRSLKGSSDPKLGELKSIVLNTAEDLGNPGPDYTYGWGRINVLKAYNAINENRFFSSSIGNGQDNTHTIPVPAGVGELKVMVYWTDPAAAAGVSKALINDIDITLSNGSQTYYPWKLNSASPTSLATKGQDRDNNMEQVTISSPLAGSYSLTVNGYLVPQGPQQYWITYEYLADNIKVTYPIGGESLVAGETEYIRWDTYGTAGNFKVEYSVDNGVTWIVKSSIVSGYARYYTWVVPSVVTGKALVRVSRNGKSNTSETVFNILGVPTNLKIDWRCAANFQLSWSAVIGATSYEVFLLGQKYMVSQTTTANLNCIVTCPNTSVNWASVRALADNGQTIGRRAIAIQAGTSIFSCVPTSVNEIAEETSDGMNVYPNPMRQQATISLSLHESEMVTIRVRDILGKEIAVIAEEKKLPGGEHHFNLNNNFDDGVYFVIVNKGSGSLCRKIVVAGN